MGSVRASSEALDNRIESHWDYFQALLLTALLALHVLLTPVLDAYKMTINGKRNGNKMVL